MELYGLNLSVECVIQRHMRVDVYIAPKSLNTRLVSTVLHEGEGPEQWRAALDEAAKFQVSAWF